MRTALILTVLACGPTTLAQNNVHVSQHGAMPDDGVDDRLAIQSAVNFAIALQTSTGVPSVVEFDAGTYNFAEPQPNVLPELLLIQNATDLTLRGATDTEGKPTTLLERNIGALINNAGGSRHIFIEGGANVTLENLAIDNDPSFATAGVVVGLDEPNDGIEVDVFEGLPHYDGMQAYSANAYDLATGDLLPVTALSIGVNQANFTDQWQSVPGGEGRRYRIENMGMAAKVSVGDGVSWHFAVTGGSNTGRFHDVDGLTFENVEIRNGPVAVLSLLGCHDVTMRRLVMNPTDGRLAVTPRDGVFINFPSGEYLFEDCYFKGTRYDPINHKEKMVYVEETLGPREFGVYWLGNSNRSIDGANATLLYTGGSAETAIVDAEWGERGQDALGNDIRRGTVTLADDAPAGFGPGSIISPKRLTKTIVRDCVFEGNFGRPLTVQVQDLEITGCHFRNNSSANIALGPVALAEGIFARNVLIANNIFEDTLWHKTTGADVPTTGAVKVYEDNPEYFTDEPYHQSIVIENNTFIGVNSNPSSPDGMHDPLFAAIDVTNARNVTIRCNTYIDTPNTVQIEASSTELITVENDGLPSGCDDCPPDTVADYRDDYDGSSPPQGWSYLWNPTAPIGAPAAYTPMAPTGDGDYSSDGSSIPTAHPARYLRIASNYVHPGQGSNVHTHDVFAIAAFTVTVAGSYHITDSLIPPPTNSGGVEVLIHVNDDPPVFTQTYPASVEGSFDQPLGPFEVGDTIYVCFGPAGNSNSDRSVIDFTIERSVQFSADVNADCSVDESDLIAWLADPDPTLAPPLDISDVFDLIKFLVTYDSEREA